jgi:hypothetical protein
MITLLLFITLFSVTPAFNMPSHAQGVSREKSVVEVTGLSFYQVNFNLDGVTTPNSSWGVLQLNFTGSTRVEYLNLITNDSWSIKNMPLLSIEGAEVEQSQRFWFPLGIRTGDEVTRIDYGYQISEQVLENAPDLDMSSPVYDDEYLIYNGGRDIIMNTTWPEAFAVVGGTVIDTILHVKPSVPNQEAGNYECAPTAVSNSLQYLNNYHGLGIDAAELTIAKMKTATNFHAGLGCWIWHNDARAEGEKNAFWEDKKEYIEDKGWSITTKQILPANIGQVIDEIDHCEDVEAEIGGHTVCVVGMADLGGGKYSVTIQHDKSQNTVGGLVTETGIWDSNTNTWSGALAGWGLNYFIVESPSEVIEIPGFPLPALIAGLIIGITLVMSIRQHKVSK